MTYYRLALQERQAALWTWKSTPLTSLGAILQLLRIYSFIPQDRVRVFTSTSKERLNEMLNCENAGSASESVTSAEFLRARQMHVPEKVRNMQNYGATGSAENVGGNETTKDVSRKFQLAPVSLCVDEDMESPRFSGEHIMSLLDRRRLEIERGAGGDHDVPYTFTLPLSLPQVRAWSRLLRRVQAGQLP